MRGKNEWRKEWKKNNKRRYGNRERRGKREKEDERGRRSKKRNSKMKIHEGVRETLLRFISVENLLDISTGRVSGSSRLIKSIIKG